MAGEWRSASLGDMVELKRGYDLPQRERNRGKIPVVSSSGVIDCHSESKVPGPGVVTGRYGTLGEVFYVAKDFWPLNTTLYVRDFKGNDPRFVSYFLRSVNFLAYSDKAAVPGVNRNHLHQAQVHYPEGLAEQRAIAHILGTLDDKIELNRRMNETLEKMARAIFKSWFVDCDPVRAKAEGRDPGLPKHIADLFPDRFEDSELGEIPAGWEIDRLGNLVELAYGKALKQSVREPGDIAVFGSNGQIGWHNERLVEGPGIIVGRKGNPGFVTWSPTDYFPIDTTFYVVPRDGRLGLPFLFYALKTHDLPSLAADSAVPGLNRNFVYQNQQIIPSTPVLDVFDSVVLQLFQRVHKADGESSTLAAIRDALLPRLISGELRVGEAERVIGERI